MAGCPAMQAILWGVIVVILLGILIVALAKS